MIPTIPNPNLPTTHLWLLGVSALLFVLVLLGLGRGADSFSERRHRRYRAKAAQVLARLPALAGDAQRLIYLRKINPYVFEELLLTAFERRGYRVRRNARYSGDGGLDGQVWIDGQRYLLQAKRYGRAISAQHLQSFGELVRQEHCMGFFIHTGRTMQTSRLVLQACPYVEVLSGNRLLKLLAGHADWHVGLADNAKRGDGRGVNHE